MPQFGGGKDRVTESCCRAAMGHLPWRNVGHRDPLGEGGGEGGRRRACVCPFDHPLGPSIPAVRVAPTPLAGGGRGAGHSPAHRVTTLPTRRNAALPGALRQPYCPRLGKHAMSVYIQTPPPGRGRSQHPCLQAGLPEPVGGPPRPAAPGATRQSSSSSGPPPAAAAAAALPLQPGQQHRRRRPLPLQRPPQAPRRHPLPPQRPPQLRRRRLPRA